MPARLQNIIMKQMNYKSWGSAIVCVKIANSPQKTFDLLMTVINAHDNGMLLNQTPIAEKKTQKLTQYSGLFGGFEEKTKASNIKPLAISALTPLYSGVKYEVTDTVLQMLSQKKIGVTNIRSVCTSTTQSLPPIIFFPSHAVFQSKHAPTFI
jgi:hypothetical protein